MKQKLQLTIFLVSVTFMSFAQVNLRSGLIAEYNLNMNSGETSGSNFQGSTTVEDITYGTDRFGINKGAAVFNGINSRINVDVDTTFNTSAMSGISYSFWLNHTDTVYNNIYKRLIGIGEKTAGTSVKAGYEVVYKPDVRKIQFWNWDVLAVAAAVDITCPTVVNPNQWYHIVITVNSITDTVSFYYNGVKVHSSKSGSVVEPINPPTLSLGNNPNLNWAIEGKLDDIRIYNRLLNTAEISALYNEIPDTCHFPIYEVIYDTVNIVKYDTIQITNYDTIRVSVSDTLIIHVNTTGIGQPNGTMNLVKVYPNPASTHLFIDNGNYAQISGYTVTIKNPLGQTVFSSAVNQQQFDIDISSWNQGLYLITLTDQNNVSETRKVLITN